MSRRCQGPSRRPSKSGSLNPIGTASAQGVRRETRDPLTRNSSSPAPWGVGSFFCCSLKVRSHPKRSFGGGGVDQSKARPQAEAARAGCGYEQFERSENFTSLAGVGAAKRRRSLRLRHGTAPPTPRRATRGVVEAAGVEHEIKDISAVFELTDGARVVVATR